MKRKVKYILFLISFLWWTKNNKPDEYKKIQDNFSDLKIPLNIFLEIIDSLAYYKSEIRVLKILIKYYKEREDTILRDRVNELSMWARMYSS